MARTKGSITHCGHCGGAGHTVRTCPEITDKPAKAAKPRKARAPKAPKKAKKPCKHCASEWHSTRSCPDKPTPRCKWCYEANPTHDEKDCGHRPYRRPRRGVTCSHCRQSGHTKRTCSVLANDRVGFEASNATYRKALVAELNDRGLGVGSLLTTTETAYHAADENGNRQHYQKTIAYVVTGFDWDKALAFGSVENDNWYNRDDIDSPEWTKNVKRSWWRCQDLTNGRFVKLLRVGTRTLRSGTVRTHSTRVTGAPAFDRDGVNNRFETLEYNEFKIEVASGVDVDPPSDFFDGKTTFDPFKKD